MKTILKFILILSPFLFQACYSQNESQNTFNNKLIDAVWSCEDDTQKEDYELMIFGVTKDSIIIAYLNFLEGAASNTCSYTKREMGNIYELVIGQCIEMPESKFVYVYFNDDKYNDLFVLLSEEQLAVNASIKKIKGWIHFERMNE